MTWAASRRWSWTDSAACSERCPRVKEASARRALTAYRWRAWLAMLRRTSVLGTVLASSIRARLAQARSAASSCSFGPRGDEGGEKLATRVRVLGRELLY